MYTTDNLSGVPVYEQIVRQTEAFILAGIMQPDSPMPSVRSVATEIAANPNTVQKAYSNLLSRGIIYAVPGKMVRSSTFTEATFAKSTPMITHSSPGTSSSKPDRATDALCTLIMSAP